MTTEHQEENNGDVASLQDFYSLALSALVCMVQMPVRLNIVG